MTALLDSGRATYEAFSKVRPALTELADGKDSVHPGYKAMPTFIRVA